MGHCKHRLGSTGKICQRNLKKPAKYCWQHIKHHQTGGNNNNMNIELPIKGEWTVYGRGSTCPYTIAAVDYLKKLGEKMRFYDTDAMGIPPSTATGTIRKTLGDLVKNHMTVPMIFNKNCVFIGGFSDLQSRVRI